MRRILLSCAILTVLALPVAAAAVRAPGKAGPGFLVVRKAADDGGVNGRPAVTVVVRGFVLGRVSHEGRVAIYQLPSAKGEGGPRSAGTDVSTNAVRWHGLSGRQYSGSNFRFRAMGGFYRVVVRGSGVYLFAGGHGNVELRGSSFDRKGDGFYSIDGAPFRSLPERILKRRIGGG